MGTFQNAKEAQDYFTHDRFATENGMRVDELGEDWCTCSFDVTDHHKNANGGVMGGAMFTLADLAFAVCSNQIHQPTVAQQVSLNFLRGTEGKKIIAHAKCRKTGRSSSIIQIDMEDDAGRDIASFVFTGFKL